MATVVITRPHSGVPGIPGTLIQGVLIPSGMTIIVDSVEGDSVKWLYTLMDVIDENVLTAEVSTNHSFGTEPRWSRYGLVGDKMAHNVDVQLTGIPPNNSLELRITNNHPTNNVTANIVRIQMQP